jgi:adenylate kinase
MTDVRTFLMMGRPGSGKGTQAKLLAKKLGGEIYSSGNRLREMAKGHGFVAQKVKKVIDAGGLLPAWFSSHMFVETLLAREPDEALVFEGACRKLQEAEAFEEAAAWLGREYRVVHLNISVEETEKRLGLRKAQEGRADDASDAIPHRMEEYENNTAKALEHFKGIGRVIDINGEQTIERVHADICKALGL